MLKIGERVGTRHQFTGRRIAHGEEGRTSRRRDPRAVRDGPEEMGKHFVEE